jgi:Tol biopolymer transport system component
VPGSDPIRPAKARVTRIAARSRRRRSLPAWVVALVLLVPLVAGLYFVLKTPPAPEPQEIPLARYEVVTATLPPTPILPLEYILSLSATPTPGYTPTPRPTGSGPAFVTATPAFGLTTSYIVFVCYVDHSDEICIMRADGSDLKQLTSEPGTDFYPSFSPDMQTIAFAAQRGGNFDIYLMDLDGGNLRRLTRRHGDNFAPAFSPDGRWIVFTSNYGEGSDQNIWLMAADGSNLAQLTFHPADDIDPMWSPDGRKISFASNRNGTTELYVMDANGANVRQLTHEVNIGGRNDWSADERYLTFYAGPRGDKNIYLVDMGCALLVEGCSMDQLTRLTDGGNNKGPSFSPDGEWITYASLVDGDNEIFIMRADGSDKRQLTFNLWPDWQPRWRP